MTHSMTHLLLEEQRKHFFKISEASALKKYFLCTTWTASSNHQPHTSMLPSRKGQKVSKKRELKSSVYNGLMSSYKSDSLLYIALYWLVLIKLK